MIVLIGRCVDRGTDPFLNDPNPQVNLVGNEPRELLPRRLLDDDPKLLFQLTDKGTQDCLFGLNMTTRQIPYVGIPLAASGPVAEQHLTVTDQDPSYDFISPRSGDIHGAILSYCGERRQSVALSTVSSSWP
jgi:hypothetical protein